MSLPQMALRFVLSHPAVSTTIVGMRKLDHVRENIALSNQGSLPVDLLRELKPYRWDRKPAPWSD
jgi:aryl-alcohol dehydrogenase-like predicted oxidoreductase